ncbi:hypothetical protein DPMN_107939 [Dreissena polymorpha]|uniref:Uncharacterized protein n=1 Tax=Dreissena polymorpha TaxID=45954 RepID=A0A9D4K7X5_DREPO|nr:hypothetical protein DPMN_107939 [Dreissena polymorpha]
MPSVFIAPFTSLPRDLLITNPHSTPPCMMHDTGAMQGIRSVMTTRMRGQRFWGPSATLGPSGVQLTHITPRMRSRS